jgi:hypothetical protein
LKDFIINPRFTKLLKFVSPFSSSFLRNALILRTCGDGVGDSCGGESDSQWGATALSNAAANGHADCARLLLDAGADKDSKSDVRVGRYFPGVPLFVFPFPDALFI